jgi:hypothetical protein
MLYGRLQNGISYQYNTNAGFEAPDILFNSCSPPDEHYWEAKSHCSPQTQFNTKWGGP